MYTSKRPELRVYLSDCDLKPRTENYAASQLYTFTTPLRIIGLCEHNYNSPIAIHKSHGTLTRQLVHISDNRWHEAWKFIYIEHRTEIQTREHHTKEKANQSTISSYRHLPSLLHSLSLPLSVFTNVNFSFYLIFSTAKANPSFQVVLLYFFFSYTCHSFRCRSCLQIHLLSVRFLPSFPIRVSPLSLRNPPWSSSLHFPPLGTPAHAAWTYFAPLVHNPTLQSRNYISFTDLIAILN